MVHFDFLHTVLPSLNVSLLSLYIKLNANICLGIKQQQQQKKKQTKKKKKKQQQKNIKNFEIIMRMVCVGRVEFSFWSYDRPGIVRRVICK